MLNIGRKFSGEIRDARPIAHTLDITGYSFSIFFFFLTNGIHRSPEGHVYAYQERKRVANPHILSVTREAVGQFYSKRFPLSAGYLLE